MYVKFPENFILCLDVWLINYMYRYICSSALRQEHEEFTNDRTLVIILIIKESN